MTSKRLGLLILLALVGAAFLLRTCEPPSEDEDPAASDDDRRAAPAAPELLTAGRPPRAEAGRTPSEIPGPAVEPEASPRGPVRVSVVGPGGAPIPGVFVEPREVYGTIVLHEIVVTDDRGEVVFADLPYDGSAKVCLYRNDPDKRRRGPQVTDRLPPWGGGPNERVVRGPAVEYRAQTGLLMHVRVVAADTGSDIVGARVSSRHGREAGARIGAPAPRTFLAMPYVGSPWLLGWHVKPPDGWVAWEPFTVQMTVSPYAERLEVVYPLRREMTIAVQPLEAEGGPALAHLRDVQVAGRGPRAWSGVEGDGGRILVRGVPFLRGEIVEMQFCRPNGRGPVRVRAVLPDHYAERLDLEVVMPKDGVLDDTSWNEAIGIGGQSGSTVRMPRRLTHENAIVATVLRRNGLPAVGADVTCDRRLRRRVDPTGRVRFEHLAPGEHRLRVLSAGLLPMARTVTVSDRGEVEVELREPVGGALDVAVVDDEHRPLAFADLAIKTPSGLPWIDMPGTVQRLDRHTGAVGTRRLTHVEVGTVKITAAWGSRRKTVKATVEEGKTAGVLIVLPPPTPPR